MDNLKILEALKQPAIDNFVSKQESQRILPSILIAESMVRLKEFNDEEVDTLIKANNPAGITAGKNYKKETVTVKETEYKVFDSVADCINLLRDYTKGVLSYEEALGMVDRPEEETNELIGIIKAYKLDEIDKEAIDRVYASGKTVVETKAVKAEEKTEEKEQVQEEKTEEKEQVQEEKVESVTNTTKATVFEKGTEVNLINANLYTSPVSKIPTRIISGKYFLLDGVNANWRYAITTKDKIGDRNFIIGYVKKEQLSR